MKFICTGCMDQGEKCEAETTGTRPAFCLLGRDLMSQRLDEPDPCKWEELIVHLDKKAKK